MTEQPRFPQHVAIIMDGNGRWAHQRGLPRIAGHRQGTRRVKEIVRHAREIGIKVLTLFAFSHENWKRPPAEISMLLRYLDDFLKTEIKELIKNDIRFMVIGRQAPLPAETLKKIKQAEAGTKDGAAMTLVLALNYGARQEIIDAVSRCCVLAREHRLDPAAIDEEFFSQSLYTAHLPDPDLLIRTSGEQRISNFLLWQLSYTELYFARKFWPDFKTDDFDRAIKEYARRQRRFGQVGRAAP